MGLFKRKKNERAGGDAGGRTPESSKAGLKGKKVLIYYSLGAAGAGMVSHLLRTYAQKEGMIVVNEGNYAGFEEEAALKQCSSEKADLVFGIFRSFDEKIAFHFLAKEVKKIQSDAKFILVSGRPRVWPYVDGFLSEFRIIHKESGGEYFKDKVTQILAADTSGGIKFELTPEEKEILQKAESGDPDAQYRIGKIYEEGWTPYDQSGHKDYWLEKAAENGNVNAMAKHIQTYIGKSDAESRRMENAWLEKIIEDGNMDNLIHCLELYVGRSDAESRKKEALCFAKLTENEDAYEQLTAIYWELSRTRNDEDTARKVEFLDGTLYINGKYYGPGGGGWTEAEQALKEEIEAKAGAAIRAAESGDAEAQYELGKMYQTGSGVVEKDEGKAFGWYKEAAEQGHAVAAFQCGMIHFGNLDSEAAFPWVEKAANLGYVNAQKFCGTMYEWGNGTQKDKEKALYWYQKAAEQGDEEAADRVLKYKQENMNAARE